MQSSAFDLVFHPFPREGDFLPRIDYFLNNAHKPLGQEKVILNHAYNKTCIFNLNKEVKNHLCSMHGPLIDNHGSTFSNRIDVYAAEIENFLKFPSKTYEYRRFLLHEENEYIYFWTYYLAGYLDKNLLNAAAYLCNSQLDKSIVLIDDFLLAYLAWWSIFNKGFIIHGASVIRENKAYIFFGPSGSGKTTVSKLSSHMDIISDEYSMVLKIEDGYFVYRPPQKKSITRLENWQKGIPVAGLFKLRQDNQNYIEEISSAQMVSELLANLFFAHAYNVLGTFAIANAHSLIRHTRYGILHFKKELAFWEVIT